MTQPTEQRELECVGWRSCAKWPPGHLFLCDDTSTDDHGPKEEAEAVCSILERHGLGGESCLFPVKTWVEPIFQQEQKG